MRHTGRQQRRRAQSTPVLSSPRDRSRCPVLIEGHACGVTARVATHPLTDVNARLPATASRAVATVAAVAAAVPPWRGRLGHLDLQGPAVECIAVELSDRRICRLSGGHLGETEAARAAGVTIGHDRDVVDALDLIEELTELLGGRGEGKAADEKLLTHDSAPDSAGNPRALEQRRRAPKAWTDGGR